MSKDSSHITLFTLPELNPLPHHVSSLPRTTKYTAILREKVWRALSRAAGFFLHQETSGVRCLGACPLTHPRIQVSAGCCPSSVQCNTARSRSLLNLSCLDAGRHCCLPLGTSETVGKALGLQRSDLSLSVFGSINLAHRSQELLPNHLIYIDTVSS